MENRLEIVRAPWGNRKFAFRSALLAIRASHHDWDLHGEDESAGWNGLDGTDLAFTGGEKTTALSFPMALTHRDSGLCLWTMVDAEYVCYCLAAVPLLFHHGERLPFAARSSLLLPGNINETFLSSTLHFLFNLLFIPYVYFIAPTQEAEAISCDRCSNEELGFIKWAGILLWDRGTLSKHICEQPKDWTCLQKRSTGQLWTNKSVKT